MALSSHCWRRSCVWCSSNRITPGPWPRCKRSLRGSSGASRSRASSRGVGLIRSRGHVPKGGYDVPNGSNHTSAVTPAIQGVVARIVTGSHDANRRESYLPMRYDADRPRAVIRFKISQPRTTSLPCQLGSGGPKSPHPQIFRQQRLAWRRGPDTSVPSAFAAGSRAVGRLWP